MTQPEFVPVSRLLGRITLCAVLSCGHYSLWHLSRPGAVRQLTYTVRPGLALVCRYCHSGNCLVTVESVREL